MRLNSRQKKQLRGLGHKLSPVVSIAEDGLKDSVLAATDEALQHHELIKIKLRFGSREENKLLLSELCLKTSSILVSKIGYTALLFKRNLDNPKIQLVR